MRALGLGCPLRLRRFLGLRCFLGWRAFFDLRRFLGPRCFFGPRGFFGLRGYFGLRIAQGLRIAIDQDDPLVCRFADRLIFALTRDPQMLDRVLLLLLVV